MKGDLALACVASELQGGVVTTCLCRNGPFTQMALVPEPSNIFHAHAGVKEMAVHVLCNSRLFSGKEEDVDAFAKTCKAVPAIDGGNFTYTPSEQLPAIPRLNLVAIIGRRGGTSTCAAPSSFPTLARSLSTTAESRE